MLQLVECSASANVVKDCALVHIGDGQQFFYILAMDMGPFCQQSIRDCLPKADLVLDRFHVMKNYSKVLKNAGQSTMLYLKTFAKSLRSHRVGIGHYAQYKLTRARIEAGNISIGMIRKRVRGLRDTEYFTLKIRQSSLPDEDSMLRPNIHSQDRRRTC